MFSNLILEQKENKARGKKFESLGAGIFRSPGRHLFCGTAPALTFAFRTVAAVKLTLQAFP
jgi:hypothetical protein